MKDIYFITGIIANLGITYGIYKFFNFKTKLENIIMDLTKNIKFEKINFERSKNKPIVLSSETLALIETNHQRNLINSNPIWINEDSGKSSDTESVVEERMRRLSDVKNTERWW